MSGIRREIRALLLLTGVQAGSCVLWDMEVPLRGQLGGGDCGLKPSSTFRVSPMAWVCA